MPTLKQHHHHVVSTHPKALSLVKERLGASGVQLGRKVVVDGQEIVEFIAASEGREDMVGKVQYARLFHVVLSCEIAVCLVCALFGNGHWCMLCLGNGKC